MGRARRRHTPEQIIRKLREAARLLGEGQEVALVAKQLEVPPVRGKNGRPAIPTGHRRPRQRPFRALAQDSPGVLIGFTQVRALGFAALLRS